MPMIFQRNLFAHFVSFSIGATCLFNQPALAAKDCPMTFLSGRIQVLERFLTSPRLNGWIGDSKMEIPGRRYFPVFSHPDYPEFVTMEPFDTSKILIHEVAVALKYARYLKTQGLGFAFVASFLNRPVPDFDGLVYDPRTGQILKNISLKTSTLPDSNVSLNRLLSNLQHRYLNIRQAYRHFVSLDKWFLTANSGPSYFRNSEIDLDRANRITDLFGLFTPTSSVFGREFQTVVDMSASGYSLEFVQQKSVLNAIRELIRSNNMPAGLVLIWNEHQILEISG